MQAGNSAATAIPFPAASTRRHFRRQRLSVWTKVQVKRDGYLWDISFTRGVTDQPLRKVRPLEAGEETGTKVSFKPDHEIFPDTVYDFNTLKTRLRELAFLNKGLHITLTDEQDVPDALARLRVSTPT